MKDLVDLKNQVDQVFDELERARARLGMVEATRNGDRRRIDEQTIEIAQLKTDLYIGRLLLKDATVMATLKNIFLEPGDHVADVRAMITWLKNLPPTEAQP